MLRFMSSNGKVKNEEIAVVIGIDVWSMDDFAVWNYEHHIIQDTKTCSMNKRHSTTMTLGVSHPAILFEGKKILKKIS